MKRGDRNAMLVVALVVALLLLLRRLGFGEGGGDGGDGGVAAARVDSRGVFIDGRRFDGVGEALAFVQRKGFATVDLTVTGAARSGTVDDLVAGLQAIGVAVGGL